MSAPDLLNGRPYDYKIEAMSHRRHVHVPMEHPLTGAALAPVGYRKNGRPIWPILGGAEDGKPEVAPAEKPEVKPENQRPDGVSEDEWKALGDPGKAALTRERQARAAAEQKAERHKDYDELKAKAAKHDEALEAAKSEQERAVDAARKEGDATARAALTRDRVLDKIEVAAAGKFRDIEDARLRLGQRADEFVTDGQIDVKAIAKAVDKVLEDAPHLKADTGPPKPRRDPSQGARGGESALGEQGREEARRRWATQKQ